MLAETFFRSMHWVKWYSFFPAIPFSEEKTIFIVLLWIFTNRFLIEGCLTNYFSACDSKVCYGLCELTAAELVIHSIFLWILACKKKGLGDFWQTQYVMLETFLISNIGRVISPKITSFSSIFHLFQCIKIETFLWEND